MDFEQLRAFLDGLSNEQARLARILLARRTTDILVQAPPEIAIAIAELLDCKSYLACLAVSRTWRRILLAKASLNAFTKTAFPSLYFASSPAGTLSQERVLQALRQTAQRDCGRYRAYSERLVSLDSGGEPEPVPDANSRYANGKHAWTSGSTFIVLDNLLDNSRRWLYPPTGPMVAGTLSLVALGDRLIVGYAERNLIAWDHSIKQKRHWTKRLTGAPRVCETQGLTVVVILDSHAVLHWDIETNLITELPMQAISKSLVQDYGIKPADGSWSHLGIVIHPDFASSQTLSLVSAHRSGSDYDLRTSFWIYQVRNGAIVPKSCKVLANKTGSRHFDVELDRLSFQVAKSDAFGRYQIRFRDCMRGQLEYLFEYNTYTAMLINVDTNHHFGPLPCLLWNGRLYHTSSTALPGVPSSHSLCAHTTIANEPSDQICRRLLPYGYQKPPNFNAPISYRPDTRSERQHVFGDDQFFLEVSSVGTMCYWNFS